MSRRRRKKKHGIIDPADLSPGIAAGLTQGVPKEEALEMFPVTAKSGVEVVSHMGGEIPLGGSRQPRPHFHLQDDDTHLFIDHTGRIQRDAVVIYTEDGLSLLREGRQCLRCAEPQPTPFPGSCDLCGYAMRDRQIMDIAMEFDGLRHLGPGKGISEYLLEQDLRVEKRKFEERVANNNHARGIVVPH